MVDILTAAIGAKMAAASVQDQIDTAVTTVYQYCGQCTNAELASKEKKAGYVWEISDSGTFAQGTDVVCDGTNWNAMAGHLHVNVIDSLDSSSQQDALSANMGKALDTGKQDKLTAGTGISISEQNVISVSGSWTKLTGTDWTTLFNVETNNDITSKKNIYVVIKNSGGYPRGFFFIPKGITRASFMFTAMNIENDGNNVVLGNSFFFTYSDLTSSSISSTIYQIVYDTENTKIKANNSSTTVNKSRLDVYYSD